MQYSTPALSRRQWCGMVGLLCAPTLADDATAALIRMLPALNHFPDYLFTEDTAKAVASAERRLACPAWDEISKVLNAYRKEFIHEPRQALPAPAPPPGREPPTEDELQAVSEILASWKRETAERRIAEAEGGSVWVPPGLRPPRERVKAPPEVRAIQEQRDAEFLRRSREARGLKVPPPKTIDPEGNTL